MKTAVECLVHELGLDLTTEHQDEIEFFLEMEKEQKIDFANEYAQAVMGGCLLNPTEFYNETFKQQEQ
jgi:hypothetical protein